MALTVKRIARLTEPGRYGDGGGLYLQVSPSGGRSWTFRYQLRKHSREMGLGPLKDVPLEKARELAREKRSLKRAGIDPIEHQTSERSAELAKRILEAAKSKTFKAAAQEYYDGHASQWTNDQYRKKFMSGLRRYAFPKIGELPVAAIDTPVVLKVIEPIWLTKNPTADRLRGWIEAVL